MNIGKNIRRIRKSKGLTIRDLSKKSEVSQGYRDALIGLTNYINYVTRKNNCELNDIDSEEIVELIESIVLTKIKFYKKKKG